LPLPHAVATVNIAKTSDSLNVVDKKSCLNKNVKLFQHIYVVMTLHSLVVTEQDKEVLSSAPHYKEQKADEGKNHIIVTKESYFLSLLNPTLKNTSKSRFHNQNSQHFMLCTLIN